MYDMIRPLLFKFDPEIINKITLHLIKWAGILPPTYALLRAMFEVNDPRLQVEAFGVRFRNPIGLAAGYDKDGVAVRGLSSLGFGHLEVGTVTPMPQPGNPRPRVFRLLQDEAVINRMGFPGNGSAYMARSLRGRQRRIGLFRSVLGTASKNERQDKPTRPNRIILGVNIGKNKSTPNEEAVL